MITASWFIQNIKDKEDLNKYPWITPVMVKELEKFCYKYIDEKCVEHSLWYTKKRIHSGESLSLEELETYNTERTQIVADLYQLYAECIQRINHIRFETREV